MVFVIKRQLLVSAACRKRADILPAPQRAVIASTPLANNGALSTFSVHQGNYYLYFLPTPFRCFRLLVFPYFLLLLLFVRIHYPEEKNKKQVTVSENKPYLSRFSWHKYSLVVVTPKILSIEWYFSRYRFRANRS